MKRIAAIAALAVMGIAGVSAAVLVSSSDSAIDSYATCEQAVTELLQANRIVALSQSYRKDNPTEYAKVRAYLDGGVRPTGSLTRMGTGLVALEDTCRALVPPPTTTVPPPTTTTPPPTTTEPPPTTTVPPPPPPNPTTLTPSAFQSLAVSGATISDATVTGGVSLSQPNITLQRLTIQGTVEFNPGSNGSKLLNSVADGFYIFGADSITLEGNTLDGKGVVSQNLIWDQPAGSTPDGFVIRNNVLKNFYDAATPSNHSEALYVGYSTNGLIEGNTFTNNGNTAHIFFTWFGNLANPATSYPRNICVRGNTFNATYTAYFDVNLRSEIPVSSGIKVQANASITDTRFSGVC